MASRGRILVVDDESSLRGLMAEALAAEGYDVHEAADGARALELLWQERPDAIVLDLTMPILNGWAFLRESSSRPQSPKKWLPTAGANSAATAEPGPVATHDGATVRRCLATRLATPKSRCTRTTPDIVGGSAHTRARYQARRQSCRANALRCLCRLSRSCVQFRVVDRSSSRVAPGRQPHTGLGYDDRGRQSGDREAFRPGCARAPCPAYAPLQSG
jgi:CheY-like chemotaxis protein